MKEQAKDSEKVSWVVRELIDQGHFEGFSDEAYNIIIQETLAKSGLKPGSRILDIGCGTGYFARKIEMLGFQVHGIDISKELVISAISDKGDGKRTPYYYVGDAETLPFKDETFEAC